MGLDRRSGLPVAAKCVVGFTTMQENQLYLLNSKNTFLVEKILDPRNPLIVGGSLILDNVTLYIRCIQMVSLLHSQPGYGSKNRLDHPAVIRTSGTQVYAKGHDPQVSKAPTRTRRSLWLDQRSQWKGGEIYSS